MNTTADASPARRAFKILGIGSIVLAIAFQSRQLTHTFASEKDGGAARKRIESLVAFEGRDHSLPIVLVSSTPVIQSFEYYFSPSPLTLQYYLPPERFELLSEASTERTERLRKRYRRWRSVIVDAGIEYEGDFLAPLGDSKGYVVTFELDHAVQAEIDRSPELELVFETPGGHGRWYLKQ